MMNERGVRHLEGIDRVIYVVVRVKRRLGF
jgi:hypothetical protein